MNCLRKAAAGAIALLCLTASACTTDTAAPESASADQEVTSGRHSGLQIQFSSFAFLGPNVAGGVPEGMVSAGEHLDISYVKDFTTSGLTSAPTALEIDWTIDGGAPQTLAVTNEFSATDGRIGIHSGIDIPGTAAGQLQLWFKFTSADGRVGFDSLDGKNYRAAIIPMTAPVLHFDAPANGNWPAPTVRGDLKPGSVLRFAYDYRRAEALGRDLNNPSLNIVGTANFIDGHGQLIGAASAVTPRSDLSTAIIIPTSATRVEVFFRHTTSSGSSVDSNFGKNFAFDVK